MAWYSLSGACWKASVASSTSWVPSQAQVPWKLEDELGAEQIGIQVSEMASYVLEYTCVQHSVRAILHLSKLFIRYGVFLPRKIFSWQIHGSLKAPHPHIPGNQGCLGGDSPTHNVYITLVVHLEMDIWETGWDFRNVLNTKLLQQRIPPTLHWSAGTTGNSPYHGAVFALWQVPYPKPWRPVTWTGTPWRQGPVLDILTEVHALWKLETGLSVCLSLFSIEARKAFFTSFWSALARSMRVTGAFLFVVQSCY